MMHRFRYWLFLTLFSFASPLHAEDCASDEPISLKSDVHVLAKPGQKLTFKDVGSAFQLRDDADCKHDAKLTVPDKLTPTDKQTASLELPDSDLACLRYKGGKVKLTIEILKEKCDKAAPAAPAAPAETAATTGAAAGGNEPSTSAATNAPVLITIGNNGATPKTSAVGASQQVKVKNDTQKDLNFVCQQGTEQVVTQTVTKGLTAAVELAGVSREKEAQITCNPGGVVLTLAAVPPPPATTKKDDTAACDATKMNPGGRAAAKIIEEHHCGSTQDGVAILCFGPTGEFIGPRPPLHDGLKVEVLVFAPDTATGTFSAVATFERTLLAHAVDFSKLDKLRSQQFVVRAQTSGFLSAAGKLKIVMARTAGTFAMSDEAAGKTLTCSYDELTKEQSFEVAGHYHFSAGVMISYTHLTERTYSRQTGDDGVTRIGEQASAGVDYVANITAYPFGVNEESTPVAVGFLAGTSLASLGKRWYGGIELSSPIGFGLSGGLAIVVVPKLDEPLVAGQPFSGDQIPTHNVAEPTYYLGVNLQAELFKRAFGALFSSGGGK